MQVESIAEQLFFTTVKIDTISQLGISGSGTGFFFEHKVENRCYRFIVTNKHVVLGMQEGFFTFLHGQAQQPLLGKGLKTKIENWENVWFGHPNPEIDIAIFPLGHLENDIKLSRNIDIFYRTISGDMIPNEESIKNLDAIESVTFIGYPNGLWDKINLLPITRKGTTASPLRIDFENSPRFLIDASVFGGSSGSPVFIFNQGSFSDRSGGTIIGSRLLFVGVIAAVFFRTHNQIIDAPIPTQVQSVAHLIQQQEMIDLGIVFKARTVVETIESFLKTIPT